MALSWYVIRVPTNQEDKVRERLVRRVKEDGIHERIPQVLVPVERVTEIKSGKKKVKSHKIYPGYLLLQADLGHLNPADKDDMDRRVWYALRETRGVGDFVGGGAEPVPMSEEEVETIISRMEESETAPRLSMKIKVGDLVRITEGPFEGFEGSVEEVVDGKGSLRISVTIFGRATSVEIRHWQVETS